MTPQEQHLAANTLDAQALRRARISARARRGRHGPDVDILLERQKVIAFWRECARTNRHYLPHNGAWWWTFTWHSGFRHLMMPGMRAMLAERQAAKDRAYRDELREHCRRWEQKKAEQAAAKKRARAPQLELLP